MKLDVSSWVKALLTLEEALNIYENNHQDTLIRDACIQRFEYCYELSHKMLRRYLEASEPSSTLISDISFSNLIRLGYARGLLKQEWVEWKSFREARNITSHTYDADKATDVMSVIPLFLEEAKFLLGQIQERQESYK